MALKFLDKDLIVVGAGTAGIHAAITASRRGLDVMLVEITPTEPLALFLPSVYAVPS